MPKAAYTTLPGVCLNCGDSCTAYVDRYGQILSACCNDYAVDEDGFAFKTKDLEYDPY
jgi:hypothetical protein